MPNSSSPSIVPVDEPARILEQAAVAPGFFRLRLHAPRIAGNAVPGQFVQVRVMDDLEPFLRRPFSIGDADPSSGSIEIVYHVVGKGSRRLSERKAGERILLLGPLGNGFRLPDTGTVLLVGGGVGMPPVYFAAKSIRGCRVCVIQGARCAERLLYREELSSLGIQHRETTEDGSARSKGLVTAALIETLSDFPPDETKETVEILACGPPAMLAAVADIARTHGVRCQVSVEERMACGFGICMGCAVQKRTSGTREYALVCVDGPVFDATQIALAHSP
ncbi:MAG TPA: dihydroorotate dehydrogenase electron transfer subunit [Candidatus Latescibacteria bacterium]|nr:dihydroorotate dehydrogenase electron transfer subunit [Candidatus Latescibacterota bacterium]